MVEKIKKLPRKKLPLINKENNYMLYGKCIQDVSGGKIVNLKEFIENCAEEKLCSSLKDVMCAEVDPIYDKQIVVLEKDYNDFINLTQEELIVKKNEHYHLVKKREKQSVDGAINVKRMLSLLSAWEITNSEIEFKKELIRELDIDIFSNNGSSNVSEMTLDEFKQMERMTVTENIKFLNDSKADEQRIINKKKSFAKSLIDNFNGIRVVKNKDIKNNIREPNVEMRKYLLEEYKTLKKGKRSGTLLYSQTLRLSLLRKLLFKS